MPDTIDAVDITAGAGTHVATDKVTQAGTDFYAQLLKIMVGAEGANDGFVSLTTPLPVDNGAQSVTLYNVTLVATNTEYSQVLPSTCRRLSFQNRNARDIRFAFVTGKVATPTAPYYTLKANASYDSGPIHLASGTIYLAGTQAGNIVEIEAWS